MAYHNMQGQQDALNKQHHAERESAKGEVSRLQQQIEEVIILLLDYDVVDIFTLHH